MSPARHGFFTVNLAERKDNRLLIDNIDILRLAFAHAKQRKPFVINAVIILRSGPVYAKKARRVW
jgi:putative transposase